LYRHWILIKIKCLEHNCLTFNLKIFFSHFTRFLQKSSELIVTSVSHTITRRPYCPSCLAHIYHGVTIEWADRTTRLIYRRLWQERLGRWTSRNAWSIPCTTYTLNWRGSTIASGRPTSYSKKISDRTRLTSMTSSTTLQWFSSTDTLRWMVPVLWSQIWWKSAEYTSKNPDLYPR